MTAALTLLACGGSDESGPEASAGSAGAKIAGTGGVSGGGGNAGKGASGGSNQGGKAGASGSPPGGAGGQGGASAGGAGMAGSGQAGTPSGGQAGASGGVGGAGSESGGSPPGGQAGQSGQGTAGQGEGGASAGAAGQGAGGAGVSELAWTFEDQPSSGNVSQGTTIQDASGHALDGVTTGALAWTSGLLAGDVAASADGKATITLAAGSADALDVGASDSFRLEVGFRTAVHGHDGEGGAGVLVVREDAGGAGFALSVRDGHLVFRVGASEVVSQALVSDGRWHRVTAVRDRLKGELLLIVDGISVDQAADASGALEATGPLLALGRADGTQGFVGALDGVRFVRARIDAPPEKKPYVVSTVYKRDAEPVPGTSKKYVLARLPAMVRSQKGTLLAFAEGRVDGIGDFGDIDGILKRSTDGGATWSSVIRALDAGAGKVGNPIPFVVGDRIVLLVTLDQPDGDSSQRTFSVLHSDDDGVTWSKPTDITKSVVKPGWSGILVGPGHGTVLSQGPKAGTLVVAAKHKHAGGNSSHVLTSADGGATWSVGAFDDASDLINESSCTEMPGGGLFINSRLGVEFNEDNRQKGTRAVAHLSPALDYTDSPTFQRTGVFRGPIVYGNTLGRVGSERFGDEGRTLFSFPAGEHGTNFGLRHDLRVYASRDQAQTWSAGKRVIGGWTAYSDLIALDGSAVGVLAETGATTNPDSTNVDSGLFSTRVDFVRTSVEWLDERTLASFAFESHAPGGKLGDEKSAGDLPLSLATKGNVTLVEGSHHSTAAHFDGGSNACVSKAAAAGWLDFGRFDTFALEATFRTKNHGQGKPVGTLASRTGVGSGSAFWLRVEDGKIRLAISSCYAGLEESNCGIVPGACAPVETSSGCHDRFLTAPTPVSDGAWHRVRAVRDGKSGQLTIEIDGAKVAEADGFAGEFVKNEHPFCIGSFADGSRAFDGDVDLVRVELVD